MNYLICTTDSIDSYIYCISKYGTVNVSLPYGFPNSIFFSVAYIIIRI